MVLLRAVKPACSSAMLFSAYGFSLFSMIFRMTAWVADEADRSIVLALLQVAFLGKCDDINKEIKVNGKKLEKSQASSTWAQLYQTRVPKLRYSS